MLRVMSKEEVEESNRKLDEWWRELGWDIKHKLQDLVQTVQHPIDQSSPMQYAEDSKAPLLAYSFSGQMEWTGGEWRKVP